MLLQVEGCLSKEPLLRSKVTEKGNLNSKVKNVVIISNSLNMRQVISLPVLLNTRISTYYYNKSQQVNCKNKFCH